MTRNYPSQPVGSFDPPPTTFVTDDTSVDIREYTSADQEQLVEMYLAFDTADRAQGIPPTDEAAIRDWLDRVLSDGAVNVVACADGKLVGHAMLVPDLEDEFELAIFVLREYQKMGIGTVLISNLLGQGQRVGVERVWLSVERWNTAARTLYRNVGFDPTGSPGFEFEMCLQL